MWGLRGLVVVLGGKRTRRGAALLVGWLCCLDFVGACSRGEQAPAGGFDFAESVPDGGRCVDLSPRQFDRSCTVDDDCTEVAGGTLCDGYNCSCLGAAIARSSLPRYQALLGSVSLGRGPYCHCPVTGKATCQSGHCIFCPAVYSSPVTFDCSKAAP